jgi:hypothetical protein
MSLYGIGRIKKRRSDNLTYISIPKKIVDDSSFPFDCDTGEKVRVYIQTINGKKTLLIESTR